MTEQPEQTPHRYRDTRPSTLDRQSFLDNFGGVYEHSPWIAEQTFDRGLGPGQDTAEGLQAAMAGIVQAADHEAQLALLRAHPDLAGRLAVAGKLTAESRAEQAGVGLGHCSPEEFQRFRDLNTRYRARFGFPFILAVKGRTRREILEVFEQRAGNTPEEEFAAALEQVHRIALLRLREFP